MFVDTSALIAILNKESEAEHFSNLIAASPLRYTSSVVLLEATMRLSSIFQIEPEVVSDLLDELVRQTRIEVVAVNAEMGRLAVKAFARDGKGRHAAGLNFGDCLSYGAAKNLGVPLLFKGKDFELTDIERAN
ncbi:MAG: type II toxin-antitoxin system VapC family toxin [Hyphomicrobiales bacterium]